MDGIGLLRKRTAHVFLLAVLSGCAEMDILQDEAARQVARDLVRQVCSDPAVDKSIPIAVLPFRGEGPQEQVAGRVRHHLNECFAEVVLLPDDAETRQINEVVYAMLSSDPAYARGLPEFRWIGPQQLLGGEFRWFHQDFSLVHIGIDGGVVDVNQRLLRWTGDAQGAVVEYKKVGLRACLFLLLALIVNWVRARMWESASQQKAAKTIYVYSTLWAGTLLFWMGLFYLLLQDYVFYLWKSA
jgi:hypothetical protein